MGTLRRCLAFAGMAVVAAACSSTGSTSPSGSAIPSSGPPSSTPLSSASLGPATAEFALVGTNGLTGPVTIQQITCGRPGLDGPNIFLQGQSGTAGPQVVMFIRAGHADVRVATGSGESLRLRSFEGSGVSHFDAAKGGQLDSPLTENTDPSSAIGDLGQLTSISGTVDCGNQQPGTANIHVKGESAQGPLDGTLSAVQVSCTQTSTSLFVIAGGMTTTGTTPVLMFVTSSEGFVQASVATKAGGSFYTVKGASLVSLSSNGAHMDADIPEAVAAGVTPHVIHVAGDATCGSTIQR